MLILFSFIGITGCDPARVLIIDPSARLPLAVTIYSSPAFYPHGNMEEGQHQVVRVSSFPEDTLHSQLYFYGLGRWDTAIVTYQVLLTDSIVLTTPESRRVISGEAELYDYFMQHRKGILHQRIDIKKE